MAKPKKEEKPKKKHRPMGGDQRGEKNSHAKLTRAQVADIKFFLYSKIKPSHIAELYGVSDSLITLIGTGAKWKDEDD